MDLPVERILWAPTNRAHHNHLHVVGAPRVSGTLSKDCTSKWTDAVEVIVAALDLRFGQGGHWQVADWDGEFNWTHMGVYNCRPIGGTDTPSQHAFSNAIDIGPYYGVEQQQKFYDFLTGKDEMAFTAHEVKVLKDIVASLDEVDSNGTFAKYAVQHLRNHPSPDGGVTESQVAQAIQNHAGDPDAHHE